MSTPTHHPPANWYPDPQDATQWRYWDGAAWTAHVSPMAARGVRAHEKEGASPGDGLHWLVPIGRSGESIAAGYLGLLCLLFAAIGFLPGVFIVGLPIAAITVVLGVRALRKAADGGHGSGRAWFGIVAGGLAGISGLFGVVASFALGA